MLVKAFVLGYCCCYVDVSYVLLIGYFMRLFKLSGVEFEKNGRKWGCEQWAVVDGYKGNK